MAHYIMDFYIMVWNPYLVWEVIRMDLFIMANGRIMLKMGGVCMKIKIRAINMQDSGSKIEKMAMANKVH